MTRRAYTSLILTLAAAIVLSATAYASGAPSVRYESANAGSSVKVEGTSNIHDWDGTTDRIAGWMEIPGQWIERDGQLRFEPALDADAAPRLELRIPVTSLEGNRRGLARNMHSALEASDHPHITFALRSLRSSTASGGNGATWAATGDLTVAGTTRSIDLALHVTRSGRDMLQITVEKDLKMTDFNIDPPTALFGAARAVDDVQVQATWRLRRQTPQATLPAIDAPLPVREAMTTIVAAYDEAGRALADEALEAAHGALADLDAAFDALKALEDAPDQWGQRVDRVQGAAASVAGANALAGARASFAVLSSSLADALEMVAHHHDAAVVAYHTPGQRGIAGSVWLQLHADEAAQPRSPYVANAPARDAVRIDAIYPGSQLEAPDAPDAPDA